MKATRAYIALAIDAGLGARHVGQTSTPSGRLVWRAAKVPRRSVAGIPALRSRPAGGPA